MNEAALLQASHFHGPSFICLCAQTSTSIIRRIFNRDTFLEEDHFQSIHFQGIQVQKLQHPNIQTFNNFELTDNNITLTRPYVSGESLNDMIVCKGAQPRMYTLKIVLDIAYAIKYLHSKNVAALNIKPQNIIIDAAGRAILVDFGVSAIYDDSLKDQNSIFSFVSRGPENLMNEQISSPTALDIFQLGLVLLLTINGSLPWQVSNLPRIAKQMQASAIPIPQSIHKDIVDLLRMMLKAKPTDRPTINEVITTLEQMRNSPEFRNEPVQNTSIHVTASLKNIDVNAFFSAGSLKACNSFRINKSAQPKFDSTKTNASSFRSRQNRPSVFTFNPDAINQEANNDFNPLG